MSKLIIVCGLPGSGKTTVSEALSKKLNLACLHKDSIIDNLSSIAGIETFEEYKKISRHSLQLFFKLAEEQVKNNVDLIMESAFNFEEDVDLFNRWIEKYDLDFYCIICKVAEEERKRRFMNRPAHTAIFFEKDKLQENDPNTAFNRTDFDYNLMPEKKIILKTDEPVAKSIEKIIRYIN